MQVYIIPCSDSFHNFNEYNKKLGKADLHHAGADDVGLLNEHVELAQHPWQNGLLNHALQQFQVQDNQY